MTASLRVKNDKYYVVLTHTTDGKKNQTWVSTGLSVTGNEGKARQLMLDMLGEKPEQAAPPDMLFSDAVRRWLEDVRHRVDEVTYQGYEVQARAHILPYFDDLQIRLCDVDGETLQTYINVKAKFGRSDGHGGLSAVSLRQHKNVLNQTLKLAQRDGLIQTNPADLVVMPHAAQFTGTFYTESQMRDLLTAVKNERLYPIIYVTALYGLRRSEVLGLKWDSINFAMQTLTIRHTVARVTKVVEKNKTKNASSFRSFPLTDDAVRLFKILLQQEQYYRNHFGKDYIDNDYVFTWEDGHPYSPDYVSHTFHKLLKKYDLPHIRFHDLRHTFATRALERGMDYKTLSAILGHYSVAFTMDTYVHSMDEHKRREMDKMNDMFGMQYSISVENQPYPVLCTLSPDGCTAHVPDFPKIVITASTLDAALLEVKQQIQKALRQYKNPPIPTKQEQIVVPNNSVLVLVKAS